MAPPGKNVKRKSSPIEEDDELVLLAVEELSLTGPVKSLATSN